MLEFTHDHPAGPAPGACTRCSSRAGPDAAARSAPWPTRSGQHATRDELMDTVAEIEALKSTLDAVQLGVVRELDATRGVQAAGWASTQDFLTALAGGHKGTGPAIVRLAAAAAEPLLAPVAEALADGWLSTQKALVIERAIDTLPGNHDLRTRGVQALLAEAKALDATELKKLTRRLADPHRPRRRGPPRRTSTRPPRTIRPPRPVPHHQRRPGRRRLDQRQMRRRGRRTHQSHPDPPGRTPTRRRQTAVTRSPAPSPGAATAATHATTAPGCSTH